MKYFLKCMSVTKRSLFWDIPGFSQQGWVSDPLHCLPSFKENSFSKKGHTTNWRKSFTVDPYFCVLKGWIQFCANLSSLTHNGLPRNCSHDEPLMKTLNLNWSENHVTFKLHSFKRWIFRMCGSSMLILVKQFRNNIVEILAFDFVVLYSYYMKTHAFNQKYPKYWVRQRKPITKMLNANQLNS